MSLRAVARRLPAPLRDLLLFAKEYAVACLVRLRPRPTWPPDRFSYQRRYIDFDIRPGEVVLDIGSGHYPFPLATILADSHPGDSPYRTEGLIRDSRPFLVCDLRSLPLRDKSIGFLYCSHVLEHLDDPLRACLEIMRVAKGGYIETPTFASDALFARAGSTGHRWHVAAIADTLAFFEYTPRQIEGIRCPVWQETIEGHHYEPLQKAFWENQNIFNTMFQWRDSFRAYVFRLDGVVETTDESSADRSQGALAAGRERT